MNTTHTTPEMRAAFEAWYIPTFCDTPAWNNHRNCYVDLSVHMAWKGWQAAQSQPAPHGISNIKIVVDPSLPEGEAVFRQNGKEVGRITNIGESPQPAPPVPASVQEIMRLMNGYVRACVQFEEAGRPLESALEEDVTTEFKPIEAALIALVDERDRLKFELDGVNAVRRPMGWISVDAELPVMADDDDDVEVWTWDGTSVREDEYGGIFEQPAGPAVGGWLRVGDGFAGDSYTRQATHWMPRHKPAPPATPGVEPEQGEVKS